MHWTDGDSSPRDIVMENGKVGLGIGDKWEADVKAGHRRTWCLSKDLTVRSFCVSPLGCGNVLVYNVHFKIF